jgi:TetR/AcrR family transcriptional regulator, fatty acid metabolism regulator protein
MGRIAAQCVLNRLNGSEPFRKQITVEPELLVRESTGALDGNIVYLADHPDEARILIVESSGLTPRLGDVRRAIILSHCRSVEGALASISRSRPKLDPHVGAVHEAVYQWLQTPKRRVTAETLAREVSSFNLRGIGAEKGVL